MLRGESCGNFLTHTRATRKWLEIARVSSCNPLQEIVGVGLVSKADDEGDFMLQRPCSIALPEQSRVMQF